MSRALKIGLCAFVLCFGFLLRSDAFALLGPFADWMSSSNGYRLPGDIGGAMDLTSEYRWNVPVVTYGFDQSFLDYFGSNGVAAVESAIQILNDLPAASEMVLTNFPLQERKFNYVAEVAHLFDLKSAALTLLLERMGLAPPRRNIFNLYHFDPVLLTATSESDWPADAIPNLIHENNYDPETLLPSHSVNGNAFTGIFRGSASLNRWEILEELVDPLQFYDSAVADTRFAGMYSSSTAFIGPPTDYWGAYDSSLTRDDAGGIRYLLSTNNINLESLIPGVYGVGSNQDSYVNLALRPGVDKITFTRQPYDSSTGKFSTITNRYTDTYVINGAVKTQSLERVVIQPDILFSAGTFDSTWQQHGYTRTGTINWWNSGSPGSEGPGVIRPPATITFEKGATHMEAEDGYWSDLRDYRWASYDGEANSPIIYPLTPSAESAGSLTVRIRFLSPNGPFHASQEFRVPVPFGSEAVLEASPDLVHWSPVGSDPTYSTVKNTGAVVYWDNWCYSSQFYFRVQPVP